MNNNPMYQICPQCHERAFDGAICEVCNYEAPLKRFLNQNHKTMKKMVLAVMLLFSVSTLTLMPGCKADPVKTEQAMQETINTAHELGFVEDSAIMNNPMLVYEASKEWLASHPEAGAPASEWVKWVKYGAGTIVLSLFLWGVNWWRKQK